VQNDPRYAQAKREVEALKGFNIHALVFVLVMAGLVVINALTSKTWWVQWPLAGWGFGLFCHWLALNWPGKLYGRDWEERKIRERLGQQ
jgi:two-component system, LytTR family, sensor kinase